ncbi:MAG: Ig-like domain-containing protein, partial [Mangrovicoccus sp.]
QAGLLTFTPIADLDSADSFEISASDGINYSPIGTVSIDLLPINDAPGLSVGGDVTIGEGGNINKPITVSDPDDDHRYYTVDYGDGSTGQFDNRNGSNTLSHVYTAEGTYTVTVSVDDKAGQANSVESESFVVTVQNAPPVAVSHTYYSNEDTGKTLNILGNDYDPGGDAFQITQLNGQAVQAGDTVTLGSGALVTLLVNGQVDFDPNGAWESNTPGDYPFDSFTYQITDADGASSTGTARIRMDGVNDAPDAADDTVEVLEGGIATGNVLADNGNGADSDVDRTASLSVSAVNGVAQDLGQAVTLASGGVLTLNADGSFTYDASAVPNGVMSDSFTYTLSDEYGATDPVDADVTVSILDTNTAPTAQDDAFSVTEDGTLTANVFDDTGSGADSDADGDSFTVAEVNGQVAQLGQTITLASGARASLNADGSFSYNTNGAHQGLGDGETATETLTYRLVDSEGALSPEAVITVTVTGDNDRPSVPTAFGSAIEDGPVAGGNALSAASDPDGDAVVITEVAGEVANLGQQITTAKGGLLTLNADGSYLYDPNGAFESLGTGQTSTDIITFTAWDGSSDAPVFSELRINVQGRNDAPAAIGDAFTVQEGATLTGNLLVDNGFGADSDIDAGDSLRIYAVNGGPAYVNSTITLSSGALLNVLADGSLSYDQNGAFDLLGGETATETFTYQARDAAGVPSNEVTATITITGLDPYSQIHSFTYAGASYEVWYRDTGMAWDQAQAFAAAKGGYLASIETADENDAIFAEVAALSQVWNNERWGPWLGGSDPHGSFSWESGLDFGYRAWPDGEPNDSGGVEDYVHYASYQQQEAYWNDVRLDGSGVVTAFIVEYRDPSADPAPVAQDDALSLSEGGAITGNLLVDNGNGADQSGTGAALTVVEVAGQSANIGQSLTTQDGDMVTINADGSLSFQAATRDGLAAGQSAMVDIDYTIFDGSNTATATASFTIHGVNDAPVARDDSFTTDEDAVALTGNLFADNGFGADSDPDSGDSFTITAVNGQAASVGAQIALGTGLLTVNADGSFSFAPAGGYEDLAQGDSSSESFTYTISDGAVVQETVFFADFDDGALPGEVSGLGTVESVQGYEGLGGFSGNFLRNTGTGNPAGSTLLSLAGLPEHDALRISFDLAVIDSWDGSIGNSAPDYFNLEIDTVLAQFASFGFANKSPIIPPEMNKTVPVGVYGFNATYPEHGGYHVSFEIAHSAASAVLDFFASGAGWQGGADESFAIDNLHVEALSSSSTATATIQIDGRNDAPSVTSAASASIEENTTAVANITGSDPDGDALSYLITGGDDAALFDIDAQSGALSFKAAPDYEAPGDADGDNIYEVQIGAYDGSVTATQDMTVTVTDVVEIVATLSITIDSLGDFEGNSGARQVTFTISRSGDLSQPVTVDLAQSGTADSADLLAALPSQVTLAAGQASIAVVAEIAGDHELEAGETLTLTLTGTDRADHGIGTAMASHEIYNDDLAPDALDDYYETDQGASVSGNLFYAGPMGDDSPEGTLTLTQLDGASFAFDTPITLASGALLTLSANGNFTYDPNGQFDDLAQDEPFADSFTYTVQGLTTQNGQPLTDTATAQIMVFGLNDAPLAADDIGQGFRTYSDTGFTTASVLGNDSDPDTLDTLNVIGFDDSTTLGLVTDNGDGTFSYDPNGKFDHLAHGERVYDSFTYTISDGAVTDTATVSVRIEGAQSLPDLIVQNVVLPAQAYGEDQVTVTYTLANQGDADAGTFTERLVWSEDMILDKGDILARDVSLGSPLAQGGSIDRSILLDVPDHLGELYLLVQVDGLVEVLEKNEGNNIGMTSTQVLPEFTAQILSTPTNAALGDSFAITGRATRSKDGQPANAEFVTIDATIDGVTRSFAVLTDINGNFTVDYPAFDTGGGVLSLSARSPENPGEDAGPEAVVNLFGFDFDQDLFEGSVIEGNSVSFSLDVTNLAGLDMTGITGSVSGLDPNLSVSFDMVPSSLAGHATDQVQVTVSAGADAGNHITGDGFTLNLTSAEGASAAIDVNMGVINRAADLVLSTGTLTGGMPLGEMTTLTFTVSNEGGLASGPIDVVLPNTPYLSLLSGSVIPSLDIGETAIVTIGLSPAANLPIGQYTGQILIQAAEDVEYLDYDFIATTDQTADLTVQVVDEFYYVDVNGPKLDHARVQIYDAFTGALVAENGDVDGEAVFADLPLGFYRVEIEADGHESRTVTVEVAAGRENRVEAFLPSQLVEYTFSVTEIAIEDRYEVVLEADFRTNVPAPVVKITPQIIDLHSLEMAGDSMTIDMTFENLGLIAANDIALHLGEHAFYDIVPLIDHIDWLDAKSSVTIPVTITRTEQADGEPVGCNIEAYVSYDYKLVDRDGDPETGPEVTTIVPI